MPQSSRLRIAIDLSAVGPNPSGIGIYAIRVAQALARLDGEIDYFILSHRVLDSYPGLRELSQNRHLHFPIRALWLQILMPRLLREIQPDLCHFTNSLACLKSPYPYAVSIHDMSLSRYPSFHRFAKRTYSRLLIPRVARQASRVLTDSEYSRRDIQQILGIPRNRIIAIPLAAEPQFRPVRDAAELQRVGARYGIEKPYLFFAGSLEPRKNLCRLLEAFSRVVAAKRDHGCRLYLAGPHGWKSKPIWTQMKQLKLENRVFHIGYADRQDLPALYSGAEAAVYPSILEGFGLPVLEAMACGTPVLTSSGSSLEEVAGDAAVYVDPWSVDSIQDGLEKLLMNQDLRIELSRSGLSRAAEFSWGETARKIRDVYRRIAVESARAPAPKEFHLIVELEPPKNPDCRTMTRNDEQAPDERELAIFKTVAYGALFSYPLTVEEITAGLFDIPLQPEELKSLLRSSPFLRERLESTGEFFHLRRHAKDVELRCRRSVATRNKLRRERWALNRLCRHPWVRMVALSGATAHANMDAGDDIDLFLVVEEGRLWTFFLQAALLAKVLGKRRRLCINYVTGSRSLMLPQRDFFSAEQLVSLRPLSGKGYHEALLQANPWIYQYFPNRRVKGAHSTFVVEESIDTGRRGPIRRVLNGCEKVILRLYGSYLLLKARKGAADIDLGPHCIKAHLKSHKEEIGMKFRQLLEQELKA